jgi:hypothetical protein
VLAAAGKLLSVRNTKRQVKMMVEGVGDTQGIVLVGNASKPPKSITMAGEKLETFEYSSEEQLLWIRFHHQAKPRELVVTF